MIIVIADVDEVAALLGLSTERHPTIIRPQTSGPCVHYDERSEHVADVAPCTYPYDDGRCPHLDNPEILCPVKGACYAMQEVARMREACECEQDEQDVEMVGRDPAPRRARSPTAGQARTPGEDAAIQAAASSAEAWEAYQGAFPQSNRTPAAIFCGRDDLEAA